MSVLFHKDSWKTLLLESSYPTSINGMEYTESTYIYIYTHFFVVCGYCVHVSCKKSDGSSNKNLQAWDPTKSFLVTMKYRHVPYGAGVFLSCNFLSKVFASSKCSGLFFFLWQELKKIHSKKSRDILLGHFLENNIRKFTLQK